MRILTILLFAGAASFGFVSTADAQCTNTCASANDNECDDGGPNSLYSICELGTDCNDCGMRQCSNTCATSGDGECDDGGPNSLYDVCGFGTDCSDCGVR